MTSRRAHLETAYCATTYRADTPEGSLAVRVGDVDAGLDGLLARHASRTWAFITAWNPASQPLAEEVNRRRQRQLEAEVAHRDWPVYPGAGVGTDGAWPAEPS